MALTIATNMFSIDTQKNLANTTQPLAQAMQRLSSGLRINNASDDAAGLAIATRMQRQINGLAQDMNNANNGISFAQTAEGSMTEMTNDLQRIYELSNESASYNTSTDRQSMNDEVQQLISELNRVATQTRFNGQQFLNQNFTAAFQVGTEVGETISVSTQNVAPNAYGVQTSISDFTNSNANLNAIASAVAAMALRSNGLSAAATINGQSLGAAIVASDVTNNSQNVINRINQYTAQTNVTAFSFGNAYVGTLANATTGGASATTTFGAGYLTINGISIGSMTTAALSTASAGSDIAGALITAINNQTSQTGVTAILLGSVDTGAADASIALTNTSGAAITVAVATAELSGTTGASVFEVFNTAGASLAAGANGEIAYTAPLGNSSFTSNGGTDAAALGFSTTSTSINMSTGVSINAVNVNTVGDANLAILAVEQGINTMNAVQANLGAIVNRFQSTVRSIENISENTTAAHSRIMDADYAAETSNLTQAMITQQAGISVLAQANTITQQVLSLLPKG